MSTENDDKARAPEVEAMNLPDLGSPAPPGFIERAMTPPPVFECGGYCKEYDGKVCKGYCAQRYTER